MEFSSRTNFSTFLSTTKAVLSVSVSCVTMALKPVKYFVVDAFTDSAFKGNPAAVCLLEEERDEKWMQSLAAEFNITITCYLTPIHHSESANFTPKFRLRWFSPVTEIEICGHATRAAAHTLFTSGLVHSNLIEFATLSGILTAKKIPEMKTNSVESSEAQENYSIELDFPLIPSVEVNSTDFSAISKALNVSSIIDIKITTTNLFLVVLPTGQDVVDFQPNFNEIQKCRGVGIAITAIPHAESEFDLYSRVFFPKHGINEDPVCGSAHCAIAAYWAQKLEKFDFVAYQASARSGILNIHLDMEKQRALLRGKAVTIMKGTVLV